MVWEGGCLWVGASPVQLGIRRGLQWQQAVAPRAPALLHHHPHSLYRKVGFGQVPVAFCSGEWGAYGII